MSVSVETQILGSVWLPVGAEDGDAVDTRIRVEREDEDEVCLTLTPSYDAKVINIWLDRKAAAALAGELAAALAEPERK